MWLQALSVVTGLRKGQAGVLETQPVSPVEDSVVEQTLPHMPDVVADMVRVQRFSGMRPAEVCAIRPCDIDRSGEVWVYRPYDHKMEHKDRLRVIPLGPKAQAVLLKYLVRDENAYCFSPRDSEKHRRAAAHAERKTPLSCGNRPGTNCKSKPKRSPG